MRVRDSRPSAVLFSFGLAVGLLGALLSVVGVAAVTAGVLVFRLATHWMPTVVGGAAGPLLWYR